MEIYVGNLPPNIQTDELGYLFQYYGRIVFIDIKSRCPPRFAFILFDNTGSAFNAVQASRDVVYNGHKLEVRLLTEEEPNQISQPEADVLPPGTFQLYEREQQQQQLPPPPGTYQNFQQMPSYTMPFPNQFNDHDKQPGKKKVVPTPMHRTLTVVEQTPDVVVPGFVTSNISVKLNNTPATNNLQKTDLSQRATIKILTPELLNKSIIDKEKSNEQKPQPVNDLPKARKTRRAKKPPLLPAGTPGAKDDPYRKGLTGAGAKWYIRYLSSGSPKREARIRAGVHTYLARGGISDKKARYLSEQDFIKLFGKDG